MFFPSFFLIFFFCNRVISGKDLDHIVEDVMLIVIIIIALLYCVQVKDFSHRKKSAPKRSLYVFLLTSFQCA